MDIKLITLSNYVRPKVVENKSRGYVLNGHHNSFYQYIIDRNNGSPTNSSINETYTSLIYGGGLTYKNGIYGVNDWAKLQTVLRPADVRKMVTDFQVFGEFACQVIKTKGGDISSINHIPKQMIVPSICNEDYDELSICRINNKCNHFFHIQCIDNWYSHHLKCPTCNQFIF